MIVRSLAALCGPPHPPRPSRPRGTSLFRDPRVRPRVTIRVVPAVHADRGVVIDAPQPGPPRAVLTTLAREYGEVYLVDAAGVRRNEPDLEFLQAVTRQLPVWVDAGSRYAADAMDALVAGASRLTLRWNTLRSREELVEVADVADVESFLVAIEFTDKGFMPNPHERTTTAEGVVREVDDLGLGLVVVHRDFDAAVARRFARSDAPRWWYGIVDRDGVAELGRLGYAGAVVPATVTRGLVDREADPA